MGFSDLKLRNGTIKKNEKKYFYNCPNQSGATRNKRLLIKCGEKQQRPGRKLESQILRN